MARRDSEEIDIAELLNEIRNDPKYKTFKRIITTAQERLSTLERDRKEIFALNSTRLSRKLYTGKKYSPSAVMEASACDMSARTRLVELRTRTSFHMGTIEKAMEAFQDHVQTEYKEELREYSTEAQRKSFIRRTQQIANSIVVDGKDLLDLCDRVIDDIDKASYQLSNMTKLIEKLSQSIGGKVV